jgi:hypothetical protein
MLFGTLFFLISIINYKIIIILHNYQGNIMEKIKLIENVRNVIRMKHYSIRTEETYISWIKRYIFFHNKRHPSEMSENEISEFLTYLAVKKNVAASTQNQVFNALLFLYKKVL